MNNINQLIFNKINLNLFFTFFLIFIIIPLNLSHSSSVPYDFGLVLSLLLITLILYFFSVAILSVFTLYAKKFNTYQIWISIISFILFWTFVTGIFFPITGNHDPFFNLSLSINKKYEILIKTILIIIFFFIQKKKDKKNYFYRFIYFFIIFNFIYLIFNVKNEISKENNSKLNNFGNKNLIVLSFDGISGFKLNEEILSNFELKNNLKDFKFYKNTISGSPYTWPSMNLELNGKLEKRGSSEYYRNILNQKNIDAQTYNYYDFNFDKNKRVYKGGYKKYNNNFIINKFIQEYFIGSVGRWASPLGVFVAETLPYRNFYKFFLNSVFKNKPNDLNPFKEINTFGHVDLFEYDIIFENIKKDKNLDKVVRMYHFSFSHWPVIVNENCEEVKLSDEKIAVYKHEKVVLKCISKKIIRFIKNLKKQEIYDNSMIIIKSDHAKPNYAERNYSQKFSDVFKKKTYNNYYREYPLNQKINNSFFWGYGRYKPFVLIKDQNTSRDNIEISNKQVFLHDLSKTYCDFFSIKQKCGFKKRNNLNINRSNFKNNKYDIYLPVHEFTATQINDLKKYEISSDISFHDFLKINEIILSD